MDFINNFHNIQGATLGERQKNFRFLLSQLKRVQTEEVLLTIASQLHPRTKLEEMLKIDIFIEFRMFLHLIELLKSEKVYVIKKIVKEKWMFQKHFESITPEMLFDMLLPEVSYTTRKLIFNRLAALFKNQQMADKYLERGIKKYGFNGVVELLPCCSMPKIKEICKEYKINFKEKHLIPILERDPQFFTEYLKDKNCADMQNKERLVGYMAKNHTDIYLQEHNKDNHLVNTQRMSSKVTKLVLKKYSGEILKDINKYQSSMHHRTMHNFFFKNFDEYFAAYFPENEEKLNFHYHAELLLLKTIKRDRWYETLDKMCLKLYKKSFSNFINGIPSGFFDILPKEHLKKIIEFEEVEHKRDFYYYLPVQESIPYYKKKISLISDIYQRGNMINKLVDTCFHNGKDTVALLEVMKYFIGRHRNDDVSVRNNFLGKEFSACFCGMYEK